MPDLLPPDYISGDPRRRAATLRELVDGACQGSRRRPDARLLDDNFDLAYR